MRYTPNPNAGDVTLSKVKSGSKAEWLLPLKGLHLVRRSMRRCGGLSDVGAKVKVQGKKSLKGSLLKGTTMKQVSPRKTWWINMPVVRATSTSACFVTTLLDTGPV